MRNRIGGFSLVVGNWKERRMDYIGNRNQKRSHIKLEESTIYGISNGTFLLDGTKEWPKVAAGKELFRKIIEVCRTREELEDSLLRLLQNEDTYPESMIPCGFDQNLEKSLCSICIGYVEINCYR